jgi:hypothetical protein
MISITEQREPNLPTRAARYLTAEVCHAAGVSRDLLRAWTQPNRNIVALSWAERPVIRRGVAHLFSWNRLMQVAVIEALGRAGCWLPSIGAKAAVLFSDVGSDGADIPGCLGPDVPSRRPAACFDAGRTILSVRFGNDNSAEPITEVHQIDDSEPFGAVWGRLTDGADGVTILDCAAIVDRVKARLAIDTE